MLLRSLVWSLLSPDHLIFTITRSFKNKVVTVSVHGMGSPCEVSEKLCLTPVDYWRAHLWPGSHLVIQLVHHHGLGSRGPLGPTVEVVFDERAVGSVLKEARAPGHGSLNNLVSHHNQDVPRHRAVQTCRPGMGTGTGTRTELEWKAWSKPVLLKNVSLSHLPCHSDTCAATSVANFQVRKT